MSISFVVSVFLGIAFGISIQNSIQKHYIISITSIFIINLILGGFIV